jgi:ligand-binding sensor domain-containing protein
MVGQPEKVIGGPAFSKDQATSNIKIYTQQQGLAGMVASCMSYDAKGNVWVGTDAGLCKFDGKEWKAICIALGGSGKRCHNEKVTFAKGSTFEYITTAGKSVTISQIRHKRIQRGLKYTWKDGSSIDRTCQFKKVA